MATKVPIQLSYGAIYFRRSNPPKEDWERDYAQVSRDGYNIFRHWFIWGTIETSPGVYDWEGHGRQMELGEKYNIRTIIAEVTTCVPEWVFTQFPETLRGSTQGEKAKNEMNVSCAAGESYEGICLDTPVGRELIGSFLKALAEHYKEHPSLLGCDIWNECNYSHDHCYCKDTRNKFHVQFQNKYKTLDALKNAQHRYSLLSRNDVKPPPKLALYTECNGWLLFRRENAYNQTEWKVNILRQMDSDCLITAYDTAQSLENMVMGDSDKQMAAENVEMYGLILVQNRKGNEGYKRWGALDLARSGARGKRL